MVLIIGQMFSFLVPSGMESAEPNGAIACDPVHGNIRTGVYVKIRIRDETDSCGGIGKGSCCRFTSSLVESRFYTQVHALSTAAYIEENYEKQRRVEPQVVSATERIHSQTAIVEKPFTPDEARCEARRCLNCSVNTIFDGERCLLCGGCVEVCPQQCLRIEPVTQLMEQSSLSSFITKYLGFFPAAEASAILKDETCCIRCGLCAERCPEGAITMEQYHFEVKPSCPAV